MVGVSGDGMVDVNAVPQPVGLLYSFLHLL